MKLHSKYQMKFPVAGRIGWMILGIVAWCASTIMAQDDSMMVKEIKPVKNTFESIWAIDQQTVLVPVKGTFEMDFQHRLVPGTTDTRISTAYLPRPISALVLTMCLQTD